MRKGKIITFVAFLTLALLTCLTFAAGADDNLQTRFEKSLKDAQSLSKVEIEVLDTLYIPRGLAGNEAPFFRTFQYSYIADGPKYRATCKLISGSQTNLSKLYVSAFDGKLYRGYDGESHYMVLTSRKLPGGRGQSQNNPLIIPFTFLTKQSDECMACTLLFSDIGAGELTNGFDLPKGHSSAGSLIINFPGPPLWKQPTAWEIVIDEASESFNPKIIRRAIPGAGETSVFKLLNYTNLGAYRFPTRIEWTSSSDVPPSSASVLSTGMVTVISVGIPDKIPESFFTLESEENSATTVLDVDHNNLIRPSSDKLNAWLRTQPKIYDESADGSKQIAAALVRARKAHKRVLLQFGTNRCPPCHRLHKFFETEKSVAEILDHDFVVVMVDVDNGHNKEIETKYEHPVRFGIPAIVVLDANGKQLTTQDSGPLWDGDHLSQEKVTAFLTKWSRNN